MAGSNAIGTGALVLSANADGLVSGLASAEKSTVSFSRRIMNTVGGLAGGPGGLLSRLLFGRGEVGEDGKTLGRVGGLVSRVKGMFRADGKLGLLGGFLFGAGVGGALLAFQAIPAAFEEMQQRARGADRGGLAAVKGSLQAIAGAGLELLTKVLTAAAPAIVAVAESLIAFLDRMGPQIRAIIDGFGDILFVGAEVFAATLDGIAGLVEAMGGWAASFGLVSAAGERSGSVVMRVLRTIGVGVGYLWDTFKAGAGVIAWVAGVIVSGFGKVLKVIGDAVQALADLASVLPEAIRPDWVGRAAAVVAGWGKDVEGVGVGLQNWGRDALNGWGRTADRIGGWFDMIAAKKDRLAEGIANLAVPTQVKLAGANERGSAGAYSIVAKYQAGNFLAENVAKQQLREAKEGNKILQRIEAGQAKAPVLRPW